MDTFEPKKLAILRVLQILKTHSDADHPLTQEMIASYLERDYGIVIERKAVSRNLSLLKEAGYAVESVRGGSYLDEREFEDTELRLLIDGVLSSQYITAKHSKDLIDKLCAQSNQYFRSHVKHIHSVGDWSKTDNQALFYNIELIDDAIEHGKQITFDYNKYGIDKKLHRTTSHTASPYQLVLRNQRYYLMSFNERWKNMTFYRVDRITNMTVTDIPMTPLSSVDGYEHGIDYNEIATALPYMYTDRPERVVFYVDESMIDQVVDWFGKAVTFEKDGDRMKATVKVSLHAMKFWALQYLSSVEIIEPLSLREQIKETLEAGIERYR